MGMDSLWERTRSRLRGRYRDPRVFQVAFLAAFLLAVSLETDYELTPARAGLILAVAMATQLACVRLVGIAWPGAWSPLISGLSLVLLLRCDAAWVAALAAVLTIASKFSLRVGEKHFFNPTNFGLLVTILVTDRAWVSAGQWGSGVLLAFFFAALGLAVAGKVGRLDISLGFLAAHAALNLARVAYLGHDLAVLSHRLTTGSLIIFAFFMLSDPRSTPDTRRGRLLLAAAVACLAYSLQFHLFIKSAPLWALLALSPATPLIDRLWPGQRFVWRQPAPASGGLSASESTG